MKIHCGNGSPFRRCAGPLAPLSKQALHHSLRKPNKNMGTMHLKQTVVSKGPQTHQTLRHHRNQRPIGLKLFHALVAPNWRLKSSDVGQKPIGRPVLKEKTKESRDDNISTFQGCPVAPFVGTRLAYYTCKQARLLGARWASQHRTPGTAPEHDIAEAAGRTNGR